MACLKYSKLSEELNKHFEQKKIIQPQEKEKTIQNLGKHFRNAFWNNDDSKTNVSAKDIPLATNDISITVIAIFVMMIHK